MGREADALPSGDVDGFDGFDGLAAAGRGDAIALQQFLDAGAGDIWRYLEISGDGCCWKHGNILETFPSLLEIQFANICQLWKRERNGTATSKQVF